MEKILSLYGPVVASESRDATTGPFKKNVSTIIYHLEIFTMLIAVFCSVNTETPRYIGRINGFKRVSILICYPEKQFGNNKALKSFISTNIDLDINDILNIYSESWDIMPISALYPSAHDITLKPLYKIIHYYLNLQLLFLLLHQL